MTPATAPAFVRAPKTEAQTTFYVAIIHNAKFGAFSPETDAADCIAEVARACAEFCADTDDPGLEHWDRWEVREFQTGKDVTSDAIREYVAATRKVMRGATFPAWWQEHDSTLSEHELDTWEPEASGQEMRDYWREHGRKDD